MNDTPHPEGSINPHFEFRELDCFWVHEGCDHAPLTNPLPCTNKADTLIYWDGHMEPVCLGCYTEAENLRWEILNAIDEGILRNAL